MEDIQEITLDYIQEITLDLNATTNYPLVSAKQGDQDSRWLYITLTQDGEVYELDNNWSPILRFEKPDGHTIINSCSIDNGKVKALLTGQCLTVCGRAYADLMIYNGQGLLLSSTSFIINIQAAPNLNLNEAISSSEFSVFANLIENAQDTINQAEAWANGTMSGVEISQSSPAYQKNAKFYAGEAEESYNNTQALLQSLQFEFDINTGNLNITYG